MSDKDEEEEESEEDEENEEVEEEGKADDDVDDDDAEEGSDDWKSGVYPMIINLAATRFPRASSQGIAKLKTLPRTATRLLAPCIASFMRCPYGSSS